MIGTRLIIIKAFATSVLAKAKINVMLDPIIKTAFNSPGFPILIKSGYSSRTEENKIAN